MTDNVGLSQTQYQRLKWPRGMPPCRLLPKRMTPGLNSVEFHCSPQENSPVCGCAEKYGYGIKYSLSLFPLSIRGGICCTNDVLILQGNHHHRHSGWVPSSGELPVHSSCSQWGYQSWFLRACLGTHSTSPVPGAGHCSERVTHMRP